MQPPAAISSCPGRNIMISVGGEIESAELCSASVSKLERCRRAHSHERGFDDAVRRTQPAPAASRKDNPSSLFQNEKLTHECIRRKSKRSELDKTHINGPHAECNRETPAAPQFLGFVPRTNGQQAQRPELKNINRLQQATPLRRIVRAQECRLDSPPLVTPHTTSSTKIRIKSGCSPTPVRAALKVIGNGTKIPCWPHQQIVGTQHCDEATRK